MEFPEKDDTKNNSNVCRKYTPWRTATTAAAFKGGP